MSSGPLPKPCPACGAILNEHQRPKYTVPASARCRCCRHILRSDIERSRRQCDTCREHELTRAYLFRRATPYVPFGIARTVAR